MWSEHPAGAPGGCTLTAHDISYYHPVPLPVPHTYAVLPSPACALAAVEALAGTGARSLLRGGKPEASHIKKHKKMRAPPVPPHVLQGTSPFRVANAVQTCQACGTGAPAQAIRSYASKTLAALHRDTRMTGSHIQLQKTKARKAKKATAGKSFDDNVAETDAEHAAEVEAEHAAEVS